jgi:hypothetical protein
VDPAQTGGCWLHVPGDTRLPDRCRIGPDTVSCCCGAARGRSEPLGSTDWCYLTRVTCDCCMPAVTAGALPGPVAADGMWTSTDQRLSRLEYAGQAPRLSRSRRAAAQGVASPSEDCGPRREGAAAPTGRAGRVVIGGRCSCGPGPTTGSTPARQSPSRRVARDPRPRWLRWRASSCQPLPVAALPALLS